MRVIRVPRSLDAVSRRAMRGNRALGASCVSPGTENVETACAEALACVAALLVVEFPRGIYLFTVDMPRAAWCWINFAYFVDDSMEHHASVSPPHRCGREYEFGHCF